MRRYMLLLHSDKAAEGWKIGPEEMQKVLEKYFAWRNKPFVVDGKRLDEETGRVIRKSHGQTTVSDGPYSEAKEVLGGYFAIEAESFDDAVRLSMDHPHLDFGSIEIREMISAAKISGPGQMAQPSSSILIEHVFRRQAGKIVSSLVALFGPQYVQLAEDAVQESMLRALQSWPFTGLPEKPEAWLFRVAHNYAISVVRRNGSASDLPISLEAKAQEFSDLELEEALRDDELRMIFMCCHPDVHESGRVALSLKLVGGFSIGEIARLLLTPEATIAQRVVRAKRAFRERTLPLSLPSAADMRERTTSVLETIYLMFTAGYTGASGEDLIRRDVCSEALRLATLISESSVTSARSDALLALMTLQYARFPARTNECGGLVLLEEQDRGAWDSESTARGFFYFERSLAGAEVSEWHIQAAIAATYAKAPTADEIEWPLILEEYDSLLQMTNSPIVALNRAVVLSKVRGPAAGLQALEECAVLEHYHLFFAVRGHMLTQLGYLNEAMAAFAKALQCTCSDPERRFLHARLEAVSALSSQP